MSRESLVQVAEHGLFLALAEGHELMVEFVNRNPYTLRTPHGQRSTMVTNYAKTRLSEFSWLERAHGVRSEFLIRHEGKSLRFRLHRGRLPHKFTESYDPQDLQPTLNKVSTGTDPDVLFLWLANNRRIMDVWAVAPLDRLEAQEGTQRAQFRKRGRRRWSWVYRLPRVEADLRSLERLAPPSTHAEVDLGLDRADVTGA